MTSHWKNADYPARGLFKSRLVWRWAGIIDLSPLICVNLNMLEPHDPGTEFFVACLCAQWCGTCRDYQAGFLALGAEFPEMGFVWIDIEDFADRIGDIDVENFPTLLIQRGESVLFFGTMLPDHGFLRRLLQTFDALTVEESRAYAQATDERREWQQHNLRRFLSA